MDKIQNFIFKNKIVFSIYLIWVYFYTYLLLSTRSLYYYNDEGILVNGSFEIFAPFQSRNSYSESLSLWNCYDKCEFFVYTVGPILVLIIYLLFKKVLQSIKPKINIYKMKSHK